MSKTRNLSDLLDANGDVKSTALDNVPASDVVNDTTPQLGGNLDSNGNSITLPDSTGALVNRLRFGNSADLTIYHDGSNSYIDDNGTGDFIIRARDIALKSITDENHIVCIENGATSLYHDNAKKFETTAAGATVTGTLTATAFSGDGSALTNVPAGVSNFNIVVITSTSTYTPTAGTKFFKVYVCGGGGGGGGCNSSGTQFQASGGGNGGNTTVKHFNDTEMGASAGITIGSGGSGGTSSGTSPGGTGGNTTFNPAGTGATITGYGGYGGHGNDGQNTLVSPPTWQWQSSTGNGDYVIYGQIGQRGGANDIYSSTSLWWTGGGGGASHFGSGASYVAFSSNNGSNGNSNGTRGGGGGGAVLRNNSTDRSGGAGESGVVVIEEYA